MNKKFYYARTFCGLAVARELKKRERYIVLGKTTSYRSHRFYTYLYRNSPSAPTPKWCVKKWRCYLILRRFVACKSNINCCILSDSFRIKYFSSLHTPVFTLCLHIIQHNSHDDDDERRQRRQRQSWWRWWHRVVREALHTISSTFIDTPYFTPNDHLNFNSLRRT